MSVPSKSIEKNKRYAGVKTNDFVNKNRPTERTRPAAPTQGWANLGKVNARRVPPPANLPSLKSETGGSSTTFDSIVPPGSSTHGWSGTNNQSAAATTTSTNNSNSVPRPLTPAKQPTQQQLDSISAHAPTNSLENDKTRGSTNSWNHGTNTTSTTANHSDSTTPNLLGLNDFPRLVTQDNNNTKQTKSTPETSTTSTTSQGPVFRPANLSSWKEGGGRVQAIASDSTEPIISPLLPTTNSNLLQQPLANIQPTSSSSSHNRIYSPQSTMWTQNSSRPKSTTTNQNHSYGHSNRTNDYKTPTILRHKDIDDLSKLNDNVTWASASQEVNYEEKIRFSDDEDNLETTEPIKPRRTTTNSSRSAPTRSRYIKDDEQHFKQMQEDKNSELINVLTVAKQRRDEQERYLRPKSSEDEQKSANVSSTVSNYSSQRTLPSESTSSMWNSTTSRPRHDTNDSQQFTMKSWSDQMDSFNYASLHEKSTTNPVESEETNSLATTTNTKIRRSPSESSTQSPIDQVDHSKHHFSTSTKSQMRKPTILPSKQKRHEPVDYFDQDVSTMNTNEPYNDWEETSVEPKYSDQRQHEETNKTRTNFSRPSDMSMTKPVPPPVSTSNKTSQSVWRHLSPTRPTDTQDSTFQETMPSKSSQHKPVESSYNERRQSERKSRFTTTTPLNTASIPPLMSVRSDLPPPPPPTNAGSTSTNKQYKSSNYSRSHDFYSENNESSWPNDDEYYEDETGYYDTNVSTHPRHQSSMGYQSHSHHRGYTTLGSYGRYRRGGSLRHQQQYSTYSVSNSAPLNTSTTSKSKKTVINRTTPTPATTTTTTKKTPDVLPETSKPVVNNDEPVKKPSPWATVVEEISIIKTAETIPTPVHQVAASHDVEPIKEIPVETPKPLLSTEIDAPVANPSSSEMNASTTKKSTAEKVSQKKPYSNQTAPRHRNTYGRSMNDYESMPMNTQHYYSSSRRGGNARMQDHSSVYYYNQSQSHYHNQYNNYSNEHYAPARSTAKTTKRGSSTRVTNRDHTTTTKQSSPAAANLTQQRHHSSSDNEQKEGEEWETASESSTNMRNGHQETTTTTVKATINETKVTPRDRTPPKKSFSSQRPVNTRHTDRRGHLISERGNKTSRSLTSHRSTRTTNKSTNDETIKPTNPMKKDLHRHSLDGYDLNNVAGVVKIETLPAGALEEEGDAFDDGGEEFCLVMSKRDRKEQKAAQLSKQNALESADTSTKTTPLPSTSNEHDEPIINEKSTNDNSTHRSRGGKSLPPRFNSKSGNTRQQSTTKGDNNMYYYDQNNCYYYYNQNQYYDQDSYYNYGNYNSSHRNPSTRRKQQRSNQQTNESNPNEEHLNERKHETNILEKPNSTSTNVMSNIDMWDPHTENSMKNPKKLIEKPASHERKFANEMVPNSTSHENSLPLHQRTSTELSSHSPIAKSNETIARTIKPPVPENKSDRDVKTKSTNYEKNDAIATLAPSQLFPKNTFLDYDDKQSIGTVGDDYNQKINSLKTIWDTSDHPSEQLEQTINTMVAMKQQQENNVPSTSSTKTDSYGKETITVASANITGPAASISSGSTDEGTKKALSSTGSSNNINSGANYSNNTASNKNEQKNICTVKPTQQVPPNIQDQVDVNPYPTFTVTQLPTAISQASLQQQQQQQQQQQHLLSQAQVNPLHQPHSYPFYDNLLPPPPQQPNQQQQQPPFNRIYSSNTSSNNNDLMNSDFSNSQSSQIYPTQNFPYRNTNIYMQGPPPSVPNTNSIYHHTSQGSMSAPPQNSAMPPPMANYPSALFLDHGAHMIGQPQPPPPPGPPQAYLNNQMMSSRPQAGPFYRTGPQQPLQTPPGPPYPTQEAMAHGGFYPTFFQAPNSNAPPVGHPPTHNIYGQNEGFHPPHPAMFARGGSMDRTDHPLMSQTLSRPTNFPSASSNQAPNTAGAAGAQQGPPQSGPPPSLLAQNLKAFPTPTQQGTTSVNQASFYPPTQGNQYPRQPMPIGAMNTTNNRQQTQQVPSLMSGLAKPFTTNGNNLNNNQSLFSHRQPLMPPQSNNNRSLYQHHQHYPSYSKSSAAPNDDTMKPKHI